MGIQGETLWITGATSGIGLALTRLLASDNQIIASGRNLAALNALQQDFPNLITLPCDLMAVSEASLTQQLQAQVSVLDRVILCAGDCQYLDIDQPDWQIHQRIMNINFHGAVTAIAAALPLLKVAERGHIIGISSLATQAPFPKAEAYGASKAALSYFLSALRLDVAQYNIDVSDVLPGFIDTPLTAQNDFDMPFLMRSEEAAQRIAQAMEKRPFRYVFPKRLYWLFKLISIFKKTWLKRQAISTTQTSSLAEKKTFCYPNKIRALA